MNQTGLIYRFLAIAALVALVIGCAVKSETLNSMINAAEALQAKDYSRFADYVDVEAIIGQAVDLTFDEMQKHAKKKYAGLLGNVADLAKPFAVTQTKKQFEKMVENGEILKAAPGISRLPSSEVLLNLVQLFGVPKTDDKNYKILDVKQTNDKERLKINVRLKAGDPWLPLDLESVKAGDHYRITRIVNLDQVYKQLLKNLPH